MLHRTAYHLGSNIVDEAIIVFSITPKGRRLLANLRNKVRHDPMGMVRISGTEKEATTLAILEHIENDTIEAVLEERDLRSIAKRELSELFEAGMIRQE